MDMERKDFLKLAGLGITATAGGLSFKSFAEEAHALENSETKMPVLFIGHGSPMNAIEDNAVTRAMKKLGTELPKPKAVLVISAHWLTRGTQVLSAAKPKMIYDMYGFPEALYKVKYEAPGAPDFATEVKNTATKTSIGLSDDWGFDHGNWSVMTHLFPKADIPVFQLSIDYHKPAKYHYELAQELAKLREKGILIIGSGNMTHNLGDFDISNENGTPKDWALEFDSKMKGFLDNHDHQSIVDYEKLGKIAKLSHPEPSHFQPLLYAIGFQGKDDKITYPHEGIMYGTMSMRNVKIG